MVTHRRLSLAEGFDKIAHADLAPFRGGEHRDHPEPSGVSERGEAPRQLERAGVVEGIVEDRRTAHITWGVDNRAAPGHESPLSPIDIFECIDHYKRIDDYRC